MIHLQENFIISLSFTAEKLSVVLMNHVFIVCSSVGGQLGCFRLLTILHRTALDGDEQMSVEQVIKSPGCTPRGYRAAPQGGSISSFLKRLLTDFHSGCISLHSHRC